MAFDPVTAGLGLINSVIDRVVPDPQAKAAAQFQLAQLAQSGELAQMQAQVQAAHDQAVIDTTEAGNGSIFVSGWRPAVGWVCALGLGYQFLARPLLTFGVGLAGIKLEAPALELGTLMTLLTGMLGFGALRTAEKIQGVASK